MRGAEVARASVGERELNGARREANAEAVGRCRACAEAVTSTVTAALAKTTCAAATSTATCTTATDSARAPHPAHGERAFGQRPRAARDTNNRRRVRRRGKGRESARRQKGERQTQREHAAPGRDGELNVGRTSARVRCGANAGVVRRQAKGVDRRVAIVIVVADDDAVRCGHLVPAAGGKSSGGGRRERREGRRGRRHRVGKPREATERLERGEREEGEVAAWWGEGEWNREAETVRERVERRVDWQAHTHARTTVHENEIRAAGQCLDGRNGRDRVHGGKLLQLERVERLVMRRGRRRRGRRGAGRDDSKKDEEEENRPSPQTPRRTSSSGLGRTTRYLSSAPASVPTSTHTGACSAGAGAEAGAEAAAGAAPVAPSGSGSARTHEMASSSSSSCASGSKLYEHASWSGSLVGRDAAAAAAAAAARGREDIGVLTGF